MENNNIKKNILIIDGDNYLSKSYFIQRSFIKTKQIEVINEMKPFLIDKIEQIINILSGMNKKYEKVIFTFDTKSGKDNNKKLYEDIIKKHNLENTTSYKGTRNKDKSNDEKELFYYFKKISLNAIYLLGIPLLSSNKYEADDVIGTLTHQYKEDYNIDIMSSDKDLHQLLEYDVSIISGLSQSRKILTYNDIYDEYLEKYNYSLRGTDDLYIIKAIVGDKSDNIQGVYRVGEKTLFKEVKKYGEIEDTQIFINNKDLIEDLYNVVKLNINIDNDYIDKKVMKEGGNKDKALSYISQIKKEYI